MRINAVVAAAIMSAAVFGVAGSQPVHAQSQNTKTEAVAVPASAPEQPKIVTVQPGDYLAKIAEQNQTTYPRLYDANPTIKDPDLIYPGQQLRVPKPDEQLTSRSLEAAGPAVVTKQSKPVRKAKTPAPKPAIAPVNSGDMGVWDRLAQCEAGGNWAINTGNGYYGGLQFTLSSWKGVGGSGYPHQASKDEQIARGQMLQARQGWGAWPACSRKLGLR